MINKMAATYPSDQNFIAALRDRNISAANYFYEHYAATLYRVIICHAKSQKQAEAILGKTMNYIWIHLEEYPNQDQHLLLWMSGIARRTALAHKVYPKTMKVFTFKKLNFNPGHFPKWLTLPLVKK